MSNVLGAVIGVLVIIIGFFLLIAWWHNFAVMFKGIFPILLMLVGAGVFIYFVSEIKSKAEFEKEEKATPEQK